jgi:hypothetical protein
MLTGPFSDACNTTTQTSTNASTSTHPAQLRSNTSLQPALPIQATLLPPVSPQVQYPNLKFNIPYSKPKLSAVQKYNA